jgi:PAS domain S-box-containing protein
MMNELSFVGLAQNAALLLAMALLFDQAPLRWRGYAIGWWQAPFGLFLGGIGILLMQSAWVLTTGIIFDTRSVLLGVSGLFFGLLPTSIAMLISAAFRLYQGGAAAWTGVFVILMSGSTGIAWRYLRKRPLEEINWRELYLLGLVIHIAMLVLMLTLPLEAALQVLSTISLPVLAIFPLGTALLGGLMVNRIKRERSHQDLQLKESRLRSMVNILQQHTEPTPELLQYALDQVVQLTGSRYGFFSTNTFEPTGLDLHIWSSSVLRECTLSAQADWCDPSGLSGEVTHTHKPLIINDFQTPHPLKKGLPEGHLRLTRLMIVPVLSQKRLVARIGLANKEGEYDESDVLQVTLLMDAVWNATQWKLAEEALQRSEANYRQLFEQAADGIFIADLEGNFLEINSNGCAMIGYSRDEILGLKMQDLIPAEDLEKVPLRFDRLKAGEHVLVERRVKHQDGRLVHLEISTRLLPYGRLLGMARNTSTRKHAEAQVQETQAELQSLLAASDVSRRVLLSMVEDQKIAQEQIHRLNAELEQRVRERTAQLQVVNQELESFAHSVSHDLRAPLRALDGFSAALLSDYPQVLDEQGQHYLNRIRQASHHMGELIEDLLSLSRVTRRELQREQVDLSALVTEIAASTQEQFPDRQVVFDIQPAMVAYADPHLIRIALDNLIGNAYKFTGLRQQAHIHIGLLEQDGQHVYFVKDNGVGFNMAYAGKLFAPFQRLHGVNEFPGTGIGLVTVQRIIHRHGGRIWPEAELGHGATFYFTLEESHSE